MMKMSEVMSLGFYTVAKTMEGAKVHYNFKKLKAPTSWYYVALMFYIIFNYILFFGSNVLRNLMKHAYPLAFQENKRHIN